MGGARKSSSLSDMDLSEVLTEMDLTLSVMDCSEREPLEGELGVVLDSDPGATPITLVWRLVGQQSRNLDWETPCNLYEGHLGCDNVFLVCNN